MQSEHSIQDCIEIVTQGIAKKFDAQKPKKVVIVGAGLAGLVAGYELKRAGHTPIILEAQQRMVRLSNLRAESILLGNTPRSITPGFKAHLNQVCVQRLIFIKHHKQNKTLKVLKTFRVYNFDSPPMPCVAVF